MLDVKPVKLLEYFEVLKIELYKTLAEDIFGTKAVNQGLSFNHESSSFFQGL